MRIVVRLLVVIPEGMDAGVKIRCYESQMFYFLAGSSNAIIKV